jgi:hypothetical protein
LGAGYRFRVQGITALDEPACGGHPACDTWVYMTHALVSEQVVHLRGRWSLAIEQFVGVSPLDVDGQGTKAQLDAGLMIGVQVGL